MPKYVPEDPRYATLRTLIDAGRLATLREVLQYIPIEVLANDFVDDPAYITDLFNNPKNISMGEIHHWAEVIDCDLDQFAKLVINQYLEDKGSKPG